MSVSCRVQVLNEVAYDDSALNKNWVLCLQWCRYVYSDGTLEEGFRFIWRRPDGSLQAARGQARIPDLEKVKTLMEKAGQDGWGDKSNAHEKTDNR